MGFLDRVIGAISPQTALARMRSRSALDALMNYNAATRGKRSSSFRPTGTDADGATAQRQRLAWVTRDMIRNNPFATKAQAVIAGAVVGDGIVYKIRPADGRTREPGAEIKMALKRHLETTSIDAHRRVNLYGLQRLVMMAVVQDGEVLLRRRFRDGRDRLPLPFQVEVLEADYLDDGRDGVMSNGNTVRGGIEFDQIGRRLAYWLHAEHPGATGLWSGKTWESVRVPASEVIHIYRQDRPGQTRGASWFHSVALQLQDLMDYQEAQVLRQKIAACFVAFRTRPPAENPADADPMQVSTLVPGRIQTIETGESMTFAEPPSVTGYSDFVRDGLQAVAAGLGITYASLSGDLSRTNFSSGRLGRIEMDQNVSAWQWLMLIPQMMEPLTAWIVEAANDRAVGASFALEWVPPARFVADPAREMAAYADMVAAGFVSRQEVIRRLGYDPNDVMREHIEDKKAADAADITFTTIAKKPEPVPDEKEEPDPPAQAVAPVIHMAAPVVNIEPAQVHVAPPSVTVNAGSVDVHAHIPRRGTVVKTAVKDDAGRIVEMIEREVDEE